MEKNWFRRIMSRKTTTKQCDIHVVGWQSEQLKRNKTCFMCDNDKPNDGHTCCEDCGGVSF